MALTWNNEGGELHLITPIEQTACDLLWNDYAMLGDAVFELELGEEGHVLHATLAGRAWESAPIDFATASLDRLDREIEVALRHLRGQAFHELRHVADELHRDVARSAVA